MVKEHGADKVANFLAAGNAENWSTLSPTEQQTRVNSYKEVVGGVISLDILLGAGGKGIKTIADLTKVNQVVGAVDKATTTSTLGKISKDLAELKQKKNAASDVNLKNKAAAEEAKLKQKEAEVKKSQQKGNEQNNKKDESCKGTCKNQAVHPDLMAKAENMVNLASTAKSNLLTRFPGPDGKGVKGSSKLVSKLDTHKTNLQNLINETKGKKLTEAELANYNMNFS